MIDSPPQLHCIHIRVTTTGPTGTTGATNRVVSRVAILTMMGGAVATALVPTGVPMATVLAPTGVPTDDHGRSLHFVTGFIPSEVAPFLVRLQGSNRISTLSG